MKQYEIEKLEGTVQTLQRDLAKQKDFFEKNYIPEESLEEFKQALETKVSLKNLPTQKIWPMASL